MLALPRPWARGLLYLLVAFVAIALPWALLCKVDETVTATGRLELTGDSVKREADIPRVAAVVTVRVKQGDPVKAGQTIVELDSQPVKD
jgi:HlyD family secretion protein